MRTSAETRRGEVNPRPPGPALDRRCFKSPIPSRNPLGSACINVARIGSARRRIDWCLDLLAIRKAHRTVVNGAKRGDALQMLLIQVKGGTAANPTAEDAHRLRLIARRHRADGVLLASWKKGTQARFFELRPRRERYNWSEIEDLDTVFR